MKRILALLLTCMLLVSSAWAETVTQWEYEQMVRDFTISGLYTGKMKDGKPDRRKKPYSPAV